MFKSILKNLFGINKKEFNFTENIKSINETKIEPEIEFTEISTLNSCNNNDLTMTIIQTFKFLSLTLFTL